MDIEQTEKSIKFKLQIKHAIKLESENSKRQKWRWPTRKHKKCKSPNSKDPIEFQLISCSASKSMKITALTTYTDFLIEH